MKDGNGSITWKWAAAGMMTVSTLLGAAWMNSNTTKLIAIEASQLSDRKETQDMKTEVGVIKEKARRIEEDVKDVKDQQKEQGKKQDEQGKKLDETNRKLDELLRRSR